MLDTIRGLVRPIVILSGWFAVIFLIFSLRDQLDSETLKAIVFLFIGSMTTAVAFYFNDRARRNNGSQ